MGVATDNSIRCIMVFDRFTDVEKRLRGSRECNILNNNVGNAELLQGILDDYYRAEGTARKAEEVGRVLCR